jgi:hypothetical protein
VLQSLFPFNVALLHVPKQCCSHTRVLGHRPSQWVITDFIVTTPSITHGKFPYERPLHTWNKIFSNAVLYDAVWNVGNHRDLNHSLHVGKLILGLYGRSVIWMFEVKPCDANYLWCCSSWLDTEGLGLLSCAAWMRSTGHSPNTMGERTVTKAFAIVRLT